MRGNGGLPRQKRREILCPRLSARLQFPRPFTRPIRLTARRTKEKAVEVGVAVAGGVTQRVGDMEETAAGALSHLTTLLRMDHVMFSKGSVRGKRGGEG